MVTITRNGNGGRRPLSLRIACIALCVALASLTVGGCRPSETPQTDVEIDSGQLWAPGATIIASGQSSSGETRVAVSSLVGIIKDGKAFLYHPTLGNVNLSDETSKQALGAYFADRLGMQGTVANSLVEERGFVKISSQSLGAGATRLLANGLRVTRSSETQYSFENPTRRWAVVKGPQETVFLSPAIAEGTLDWAKSIVTGRIEGGTATITVGDTDIETYSSMASIAMLFAPSLTNAVAVGQAIVDGVTFQTIMDHAREALDHDEELFLTVNAVELFDLILAAVEHIAGVVPCADRIIDPVGPDAARTALRVLLTQGDAEAVGGFFASSVLDMAIECPATSTGIGAIIMVVKDILILVGWDVQVTQGALQSLSLAAYDEVEGISRQVATPTFSPNAGSFAVATDVTISCATTGATIRYTTDGSAPSESAGTVYSGPIHLTATTTIKAIAYKAGMTASPVASATFTKSGVPGTLVITKASEVNVDKYQSGVAVSPDDAQLYVAFWEDENNSRVQQYSLPGLNLLQTITFGGYHTHMDVEVSADGNRIFTTNYYYQSISQVEMNNGNRKTDLSTTGSWPADIVITPDCTKVLTADGKDGRNYDMNNDYVTIYDIGGGRFATLGSVKLDDEISSRMAVSDDGHHVYIPTRKRKSAMPKLYEVSLQAPYQVTRTLEFDISGALGGVACSEGQVYVADGDAGDSKVWLVDTVGWTKQGYGVVPAPQRLVKHPTQPYLFALLMGDAGCSVCAIDPRSMQEVARCDDLPARLNDLEFNSTGTKAYLCRRDNPGGIVVLNVSW